jgi:hypothetical protein
MTVTICIQPLKINRLVIHPLEKRILDKFFDATSTLYDDHLDYEVRWSSWGDDDSDNLLLEEDDQAEFQLLATSYPDGRLKDWVFREFDKEGLRWEEFPLHPLLHGIVARNRLPCIHYLDNEDGTDLLMGPRVCFVRADDVVWRSVSELAKHYSESNDAIAICVRSPRGGPQVAASDAARLQAGEAAAAALPHGR